MEIKEVDVKFDVNGNDAIFVTIQHQMHKDCNEISCVFKRAFSDGDLYYFILNSYNVIKCNGACVVKYKTRCYYNWRNKPELLKTPWKLVGLNVVAVKGEEVSSVLQDYYSCDC